MARKLRWQRLWLVASVLWIAGTCVIFWKPISEARQYANDGFFNQVHATAENQFESCLNKNNTNSLALWIKYKDQCTRELTTQCGSCSENSEFLNSCVEAKSAACGHILYDSQFIFPTFSDKITFWLSDIFLKMVGLVIFGPLAMRFLPAICRRVWGWFTSPVST